MAFSDFQAEMQILQSLLDGTTYVWNPPEREVHSFESEFEAAKYIKEVDPVHSMGVRLCAENTCPECGRVRNEDRLCWHCDSEVIWSRQDQEIRLAHIA